MSAKRVTADSARKQQKAKQGKPCKAAVRWLEANEDFLVDAVDQAVSSGHDMTLIKSEDLEQGAVADGVSAVLMERGFQVASFEGGHLLICWGEQ